MGKSNIGPARVDTPPQASHRRHELFAKFAAFEIYQTPTTARAWHIKFSWRCTAALASWGTPL